MTPYQIAAKIERLANAATPGPWKQHPVDDTVIIGPHYMEIEIADCWAGGGEDDDADFNEDTEQHEADAAYIAAANPANLKVLLADRAALLAKCERYRDALEAIEDHTETDMDTGETGLSEAAQIARTALTEAP